MKAKVDDTEKVLASSSNLTIPCVEMCGRLCRRPCLHRSPIVDFRCSWTLTMLVAVPSSPHRQPPEAHHSRPIRHQNPPSMHTQPPSLQLNDSLIHNLPPPFLLRLNPIQSIICLRQPPNHPGHTSSKQEVSHRKARAHNSNISFATASAEGTDGANSTKGAC